MSETAYHNRSFGHRIVHHSKTRTDVADESKLGKTQTEHNTFELRPIADIQSCGGRVASLYPGEVYFVCPIGRPPSDGSPAGSGPYRAQASPLRYFIELLFSGDVCTANSLATAPFSPRKPQNKRLQNGNDDLVGAAEQPLDGLEIKPLARHVRRLLVFLVNFLESAPPGRWPRPRSARGRPRPRYRAL